MATLEINLPIVVEANHEGELDDIQRLLSFLTRIKVKYCILPSEYDEYVAIFYAGNVQAAMQVHQKGRCRLFQV